MNIKDAKEYIGCEKENDKILTNEDILKLADGHKNLPSGNEASEVYEVIFQVLEQVDVDGISVEDLYKSLVDGEFSNWDKEWIEEVKLEEGDRGSFMSLFNEVVIAMVSMKHMIWYEGRVFDSDSRTEEMIRGFVNEYPFRVFWNEVTL